MTAHEQRLKKLRNHLRDARDELHALPDKETTDKKTDLARLDDVIGHAIFVLEGAEAALVSTQSFMALQSAACTISNDPRVALRNADACADALLDAVALLPGRGGREVDQELQRVAADFERSAAHRLSKLRAAIQAETQRVETLRSDLDHCASALGQQVEQQAAFESKLAALDQEIGERGRAHDEQLARLGNELAGSRQENTAALQAELDDFRGRLAEAQEQACDKVEDSLAAIRRMERESAELVGSIGLAGAADLYHQQGRRQRRIAEVLRGSSILTALAAVALALSTTALGEPTAESLSSYLFASLLLAGLAGYLAFQSERHRARERHASALHLDLVAFSPFIEALPPEQRTEERVLMTRKIFAESGPGPDEQDERVAA